MHEWLVNDSEPDANMLLHYGFDETTGTIADNSSTYEFYHPLLSDAELYDSKENLVFRVLFCSIAAWAFILVIGLPRQHALANSLWVA